MRYTESRLTRIAGEMLADIDSDTVDFSPNYDESTLEPSVLPARIPNLIINGSSGIAVGMATNIPPHNLAEVVNAAIALLSKSPQDHRSDLELVLEHVQGPDFPTGGFLHGRTNIPNAYRTGRGRFMMRAKCAIENISGGRQAIIVTEIPYQVNKSKLIERIAELVNEGVITDIARDEFRDESDRDGMRIVIGLKRGAEHQIVLNQLHKHTQMQESFSMIFLAVHNGQPKELPLDHAIRAFLDHRVDVVRRRTAFLLSKARDREHILLGYQIALDHLDTVIRIIRQSGSRPEARERLFSYFSGRTIDLRGTELAGVTLDPTRYNVDMTFSTTGTLILSYRQVDAILELQLYRLTQLSIDELLNELRQVRDNIAEFESILASQAKLRAVIIKELEEVRDKYGDARRTIIIDETAELQLEDLIADEQVAVTVSNTGYLKRTPISIYRQQRRGGTGRLGMKTREEDFVAQLIIDSTHAYLLCFTNTGRVYWVKVYEVPDVGAAGKGKAMASLIDLQPGEKVVTILPVRDLTEEGKNILFATRNGTVKKTALKDFSNVMARGIIAIGIDKDDELITARVTDGKQVIFLATHDGMAIRFDERDLRPMGRPAYGNKGINLRKGDYVVGAAATPSDEARNAQRREHAEKLGLTAELNALIGAPSTADAFREAGAATTTAPDGQELLGSNLEDTHRRRRPGKPGQARQARPEARPHLLPHPLGQRERLRQAHRRRPLPPAVPRRHRRHQHEDDAQDRQGRRHQPGQRHDGADGHQPIRQDHPHRHQVDPRRRPLHHGRQAARPGRPGQVSPPPSSSPPRRPKPSPKKAPSSSNLQRKQRFPKTLWHAFSRATTTSKEERRGLQSAPFSLTTTTNELPTRHL